MELTWEGTRGWCEGREIGQIYERANGWQAMVAHTPVDDVLHATLEEAQAAVDTAVVGLPLPQAPPRRERRRHVPNTGPEWAPHPGTVPAHKRR